MVRLFFFSRAATKKFSRRFSGKHAPQSERFRPENFILPLFDNYPFPPFERRQG
ncbi:DUF1661 domain-containing protein [Porphyromonas gingivalis]|uniref:DUF1661 domain-containing protein n=1 Tax=Porphyromonas gingivalis TaxID=837 RepID=A0AAF0BDV3_PORGN|nr:DUF1661 domain-containing protein [Porphyromonas gingivalis]USI95423.1 DUF1661 domain-containing protein [Porphyromonas gingivalis]USI97328.1 DUF1661 domain-containing protein [Porphyromonas gingivalis]WCG02750.1 DUF1661 domain-containing protein [Porphyromonas gingivalis]